MSSRKETSNFSSEGDYGGSGGLGLEQRNSRTPVITIDGELPTKFIEFDPLLSKEQENEEDRIEGDSFARSDHLHVNAIALLLKRRREEKKRAMESFLQFLEVEIKTPAPSRVTTVPAEAEKPVPIPLLLSPELHPTHKNYAGSHRLGRRKHGVVSLPTMSTNTFVSK